MAAVFVHTCGWQICCFRQENYCDHRLCVSVCMCVCPFAYPKITCLSVRLVRKFLRHHHINRHSKSVRSCHPLNIENAGKLSGSRGTAIDSAGKLTAHPTLQAGAQGATIRLAVTQSPPLVLPVSSFCPLYLVFYPTLTTPTHYTGVVCPRAIRDRAAADCRLIKISKHSAALYMQSAFLHFGNRSLIFSRQVITDCFVRLSLSYQTIVINII